MINLLYYEYWTDKQKHLYVYEKEWKEGEQLIKNLEENVSVMNKKTENFKKEIDKHEQYYHWNCL